MAGTLTISTLSDGTNSTSSSNCIQGSAKAWVTFAGATGTVSASYNVSSVTRNSQGNYTVNFTTAFADANYAVSLSLGSAAAATFYAPQVLSGGQTTTSSVVASYSSDPVRLSAAYFR